MEIERVDNRGLLYVISVLDINGKIRFGLRKLIFFFYVENKEILKLNLKSQDLKLFKSFMGFHVLRYLSSLEGSFMHFPQKILYNEKTK